MEPKVLVTPEVGAIVGGQGEPVTTQLMQPVAETSHIVAAFRNYQQLKNALLDASDYQAIANKKYIKKAGWRKIATAFGLSDDLVKEERRADGDSFTYEVTVRVTAQNGRRGFGVGSCSSSERRFAHPEHDVRATAHTRAKNRGISDLVGFGELSAEEMDGTDRVSSRTTAAPRETEVLADVADREYDSISTRQEELLRRLILEKAPAEEHKELLGAMPSMTKREASLLISGLVGGGYWGK